MKTDLLSPKQNLTADQAPTDRSKFRHSLIALAATCLAIFSGCAEDRSLDDYKRNQLREYLGQYQAAAGTFRGTGYRVIDNASMGNVELVLTAKIKSSTGITGSKTEGTPVLIGKITLYGEQTTFLDAEDSFYDPKTGDYLANIPVKQQNGKTTEIAITGKLIGNRFEGSIEASGYPSYGGRVSLSRSGSLPDSESGGSSSGRGPQPPSSTLGFFQGTTTFRSGPSRSVGLVMLSTTVSAEEDFLENFNPVRTIQVMLNYGESVKILYPEVEWNQQYGRMLGYTTLQVNNKNETLSLSCLQSSTANPKDWDCQISTSSSGEIARTRVSPATSGQPAHPVEPGDTDPILMQYQGQAKLVDGSLTPVTMSALLAPRSRESELMELFFPPAERLMTVTLQFSVQDSPLGSSVPVNFKDSHWDLKTHTLNGSVTLPSMGGGGMPTTGAFSATLNCKRFEFAEAKAPFDCIYIPDRLGAPIQIQLQKKL